MKSTFFEYYNPSEDEIKAIWEDSFISLDANVLLNLYRYTEDTKNDFFKILDKYKDNLILTYQAGKEYHKNRLIAINSQLKSYDTLLTFINDKSVEFENELNKYKKHSFINSSAIKGQFTKTFNNVKNNITKLKEEHPNLSNEDPTKDFLTTLFDKKITEPYDDKKLKEIFTEGKARYEKQVPPGYKDLATKKNNEESTLYGDLIIWFQIIDFAKEKQKPIIFVTDDLKDDWWFKFEGETKGPRMELLKEFYKKSQQKVLIYNPDSFLRYTKDIMGADIKESSIEEIIDVRIKEKNNFYDFVTESMETAIKNAKIQDKILSDVQKRYKFIDSIINSEKSHSFYNLTESEKLFMVENYIFLSANRKQIINKSYKLDFLSEDVNPDTFTPSQISEIRNFIKFYTNNGSVSDDILELII